MTLRRGGVPLHLQLAEILRECIAAGKFAFDEPLPTEDALTRVYGVSRTVVRQTMLTLQNQGLIRRIAGKGTFVRNSREHPFEGWSINSADDLAQYGLHTRMEILERLEVPAPDDVAHAMAIAAKALVSEIRAVRYADEGVFAYQRSYSLLEIGRRVAAQPSVPSLLLAFQEHGRVNLSYLRQAISAVAATRDVARILEVRPGDPLLQFEWSMVSTDGAPVTFSRVQFRSDRYRHVTKLLPGAG